MYHCEIWADADPFFAGADPCIRNFIGHPCYVLGTILLCYQLLICCGRCIAVKFGKMPILSVQVPIHASEILSDIHAMCWEPYYYVTNILICCGRCIAVKLGQMPIHSMQVPIRASENCRTSTLCIGNHTTMLPIY